MKSLQVRKNEEGVNVGFALYSLALPELVIKLVVARKRPLMSSTKQQNELT